MGTREGVKLSDDDTYDQVYVIFMGSSILKQPSIGVGDLPSDSSVFKRGSTQKKRSILASTIEIDQGRQTVALEDRIRLIRAKNEEILKRRLEVEADKLKYT